MVRGAADVYPPQNAGVRGFNKDGTRRGDYADYGGYAGYGYSDGYAGAGPSGGYAPGGYDGGGDYGGYGSTSYSGYGSARGDYRPRGGAATGKGGYNNPSGWGGARGGYGDRAAGGVAAAADRTLPGVAHKLEQLRGGLPDHAIKTYHALQMALQSQTHAQGSRPNFERDFHEHLASLFPDAWDISTRQIGSMNQWEVTVDGMEAVCCSVRLEVLADDKDFMRQIKTKARVVKDTLLENGGQWKRALQPEAGAFSTHTLDQFQEECATRVRQDPGGKGLGGSRGGQGQRWVEVGATCNICGKSKEEDQLSGEHMCVVFANFDCDQCQHRWTSYHARLRQDGCTVIGQKCSTCRANGNASTWRVMPNQGWDQSSDYSSSRGMHQGELCNACIEFGNCMGVFYDPFILTTALSLASGEPVQWRAFSEEMPELLVADLGPQFRDMQICLQPHVYVKQGSPSPGAAARRKGSSEQCPSGEAPRAKAPPPGVRGQTGVSDAGLLAQFLKGQQDTQPPPLPPSLPLQPPPPMYSDVAGDAERRPAPPSEPVPSPPAPILGAVAAAAGPGDIAGGGGLPEVKKTKNKISAATAAAGPSAATPPTLATPCLDALPPLRRAQFLQVVLRQVKLTGGSEADKFSLAEEHLASNGGEYERAYAHVKALGEGGGPGPGVSSGAATGEGEIQ